MTFWIVEPRDPLIARDGRPFSATPGARATSLAFPYPSTLAGAVRTRAGTSASGEFDKTRTGEVRRIGVKGPLLVQLGDDGEITRFLAPAPGDAVLLKPDSASAGRSSTPLLRRRLAPLELPPGAQTDAWPGKPRDLAFSGMVQYSAAKPDPRPPAFWWWDEYAEWLASPSDDSVIAADLGHPGPTRESRTHVQIDHDSQTAVERMLFGTRGLEFTGRGRERLALVVEAEAPGLSAGYSRLGGENRLASWRAGSSPLPVCPEDVGNRVAQDKACRVILLTPACFETGWRPQWLLGKREGVTPTLVSAIVTRPQVISGWDMAAREEKPTRRLVPAGSVFFLRLTGSEGEIRAWEREIWMQCISDGEQDQLDGFGLAALGTWSGHLVPMTSPTEAAE